MKATVKITETTHRSYTHRVRFPAPDGKRLDRYFSNEAEAKAFAKDRGRELGDVGLAFAGVTEAERAAVAYWRGLTARTQDNPPPALLEVLRDFGGRWEAAQAGGTVAAAVASFIEAKTAEGVGTSHLLALETRLGRFGRDFGNRVLATFTTAEISDWILGLSGTKTAPGRPADSGRGRPQKQGALSLQTKKNHRLALHSLFAWAKTRGMVGTNPVSDSAKPRPPKTTPGIIKPAQVAAFLAALVSRSPAIVPFWAVRVFAGIRESEAVRMTWEMVDLTGGKINLPATATKTGKPRVVTIEPALAAFLAPHAKKSGHLAPQTEMARRHALAMAKRDMPKGFAPPSNWARHTFATMHLHGFQDAGKTSLQLGHGGSPEMLHAHYASFATDAEAAAFWAIRPETLPQPGNVVSMTTAAPEAATPATVKQGCKKA
ncbi:MAG: site-specific integrase [Verrucomicrobia bacterium]|nr:site-specific integrase [Verrucomicrobiota bacterium]